MKLPEKLAMIFYIFIFAFVTHYSHALTPEQIIEIDKLINEVFIPYNNVTGTSLSIVENGTTVYSKGYGKRDVENGIDATNETVFAIGSISKSFIATLAVKVLSEKYPQYGEHVLDMPIVSFQSNFNFTFSDRYRAEQTSFRDLLSHRTCLVSPDLDIIFISVRNDQEYNYRTRYETGACGHRGFYVYNNALYSLVGQLIASLAGKSLHEMVRELMSDIGMTSSTTVDETAHHENFTNLAQGYYQRDGKIHRMNLKLLWRERLGLGAGGVLSTSNDMGKYMEFHLNEGKVGNRQVIAKEAMRWMQEPSIHRRVLPGSTPDPGLVGVNIEYAYGLGLSLGRVNGFPTVGHAGNAPPYLNDMRFYEYEGKKLGVFLTTNGPGAIFGPSNVPHTVISAGIFEIVRTGSYKSTMEHFLGNHLGRSRSWNINNAPIGAFDGFPQKLDKSWVISGNEISSRAEPRRRQSKIEFGEVMGLYGERLAGDLSIRLDTEDARFLQVNYGEWGIGRLLPVNGSETKFLIQWKTDIVQHFYTFPEDVLPVPNFYIDFYPEIKSLDFLLEDETRFTAVMGATIGTFPAIPWDPTSCGPSVQ